MVADMHAHYPMHVVLRDPASTLNAMCTIRGRPLLSKLQAIVLRVAMRVASDRDLWSEHRVSVETLTRGGVGLAFSVLYCPEQEFDPSTWDGDPPDDAYFQPLVDQMDAVESDLAIWSDSVAEVVTNRADLDERIAAGGIAFVHCVEGGYHLGDEIEQVEANVAALAARGVAYITLAHLFYRQVANGANAFPFVPDWLYRHISHQPRERGLTARGEAAVRAMVSNRVLVDLSHMDHLAMHDTLDLLDDLDTDMPVVATHAGFQFGKQEYMLDEPLVKRVQGRDGVIGLIMAQHQLRDGLDDDLDTFEVIRRHVDKIAAITGSNRHVALGTDLDGFVKPTMDGIQSSSDLASLEQRLAEHYGAEDAQLIASGNALRALRAAWS
jgi:microsomal dipeptidase-like Zn-dependent dipeptidase